MKNMRQRTNWTLLSTSILACLLIRLLPLRAPNVEPILGTQMPFAKAYGGFIGFIFGVLSIVLYDVVTGTVGLWTFVTASVYGIIGFGAAQFFQNRTASRKNFVIFAIGSTLFYDALTGLTIGPLFFHQSFITALIGQIPFTALHLVGNIVFAALVSPALYLFLLQQHQRHKIKNLQVAYQIINQ